MHRTDAPGNVAGLFSAGDPANGILPTILDEDWHNAVQENIARLIEAVGIALVKGDHTQLMDAVAAMISNAELTPAQILAKLITVDGAGSLLDADLLDGLQSTDFFRRLVGTWLQSSDGIGRWYFENGGATYFGCGPGGWNWQYDSDNKATLDINGTFFARQVVVEDGSGAQALLAANGDITAKRADGNTGVVFLGRPDRYIYSDGIAYTLPGAPLYVSGGYVWTSNNDGAGSGLDSDLLRGLGPDQVVSLARVLAALTYTPLNAASYTAADVLAKLLTVDGSGSLLDADTVDGLQGSALVKYTDFTGANQSLSASGYQKLPGGLILQFGTISLSADSYATITFPINFPAACTFASVEGMGQVGNNDAANNNPRAYSWAVGSASVYNPQEALSARWFAVGY